MRTLERRSQFVKGAHPGAGVRPPGEDGKGRFVLVIGWHQVVSTDARALPAVPEGG